VLQARNPYGLFRRECMDAVKFALQSIGLRDFEVELETPPRAIKAELAFPCFSVAKKIDFNPLDLAGKIVDLIGERSWRFIERVEVAGGGYVNFYLNYSELASEVFRSVELLDVEYGKLKADRPMKIIVEHTSANPIHPLHIGAARNAVLGDTLARLLRARGHEVKTHFYIDDVGFQVAIAAYGYSKVRDFKVDMKPDHFIGLIYAMTNCIVEIWKLKKRLEELKTLDSGFEDEIARLNSELSEWISIANELRERDPDLFDKLLAEINSDENPVQSIIDLDYRYELGYEDAVKVVREMCEKCIEGFKDTLEKMNVHHDSWDWESEVVWSSRVKAVLEALKKTPFVKYENGALIFEVNEAARALDLKSELGVNPKYEIPKLTLVRSDGRTLYTTRDIAYTLWQFEHADKVIHVIGAEQSLPQLQLRVALAVLGRRDLAVNMVHYAYELVHMPGFRMSSRRGRYIDLDRILSEAIERAREEVIKRSPHLSPDVIDRISRVVGIGAVRYALLSISPSKKITFTWDRVLDFERNSAPFIQYAHARACNILAKFGEELPRDYDTKLLNHELERSLILQVAKLPEVIAEAADTLRVELLTDYAYRLALTFNSFYDAIPVLKAEPRSLRNARLHLVNAVRIALRNILDIMGIEAPSRM